MSSTITVLVAVPVFPDASVDEYVSVYVPFFVISTEPEVVTVTFPERSVADAPASE